jgi:hypothetical protein
MLTLQVTRGFPRGFSQTCVLAKKNGPASWFQAMGDRGLGHNDANEVISQDVRPDLLSHQHWRLAGKFMHLQGAFDRAQIEFVIPTRGLERR